MGQTVHVLTVQAALVQLLRQWRCKKNYLFLQPPRVCAVCRDRKAATGKKFHVPVNKVKACSASTERCTGPVNVCSNSPEIAFPFMLPAGKILKETIGTGSHSTPLLMALLRSLWLILQVMWDWEKAGIFKDIHIPSSQGCCLCHTAWKSVPHLSKKRAVMSWNVEN